MKIIIIYLLSSIIFISTPFAQDSHVPLEDSHLPQFSDHEKIDRFNLSYYESMYILIGNPTTKIKFSFKYKFFRQTPIYFGYVQNILWLFFEESHPFKDTNFNPRLFYRLDLDEDDPEDYLDLIAYEHKSNGVGESASRSYDSLGAKIAMRFENSNWSLRPYFKGLYRYNLDEPNIDYEEYVGPFEAGIGVSTFFVERLDRAELTYRFFTGGKWGGDISKMSHELGFSFRLFGKNLTPSIYVQYFSGYSESLLSFKDREDMIRIGFLL